MKLNELKCGERARLSLRSDGNAAEAELLRRGILPSAEVTCLFRAPSGDPTAYRMGKIVFALRRETAEKIEVSEKTDHSVKDPSSNRERNGMPFGSSEKLRPRR